MKRISFICLTLLLLASCHRAPQFATTVPPEVQNDTTYSRILAEKIAQVNELATQCVKMYHQAEKYRNVDFNTLSESKQRDLVKLDLEYAQLWYLYDLRNMNHEMSLLTEAKYSPERFPAFKAYTDIVRQEINPFVDSLKATYGTDLKLDRTSPLFMDF